MAGSSRDGRRLGVVTPLADRLLFHFIDLLRVKGPADQLGGLDETASHIHDRKRE